MERLHPPNPPAPTPARFTVQTVQFSPFLVRLVTPHIWIPSDPKNICFGLLIPAHGGFAKAFLSFGFRSGFLKKKKGIPLLSCLTLRDERVTLFWLSSAFSSFLSNSFALFSAKLVRPEGKAHGDDPDTWNHPFWILLLCSDLMWMIC